MGSFLGFLNLYFINNEFALKYTHEMSALALKTQLFQSDATPEQGLEPWTLRSKV